MRKLGSLLGFTLVALLATASPASAHERFRCDGDLTGVSVEDVVVPRDGSCTLIDSTVGGSVKVERNGYFEARNTDITGSVKGHDALTLFVDAGSTVGRSIRADDTFQVFVFDSTVGHDIDVDGSDDAVQVCGTTVADGNVRVDDSKRDILIGAPDALDCAANTFGGDVTVKHSDVDIELVIAGNTIADDLRVLNNRGAAAKLVEDNVGGDELECRGNEDPFSAAGNTGWDEKKGQCDQRTVCDDDTLTGQTLDDVVVPRDGVCVLDGSTVNGDVHVLHNGYFEGRGSDISGDVEADDALTVFIDAASTVGGRVETDDTFQVFVFDSTVSGGVDVEDSDDAVQVCGTTVDNGHIVVDDSRRDILIGHPGVSDCAANSVSGDIRVTDNVVDVELIVRGNTVGDDLRLFNNRGTADKVVQDNVGGDELECRGNTALFTGTPNTGFATASGQCAQV